MRPQALLGLIVGLVRFWYSLLGWLAHVDPERCGSRLCIVPLVLLVDLLENGFLSAPHDGMRRRRIERSRAARAPLQRPSGRIPMGRWLSDPSRTAVLAPTKLGVAVATANGQAHAAC